MAGWHMLTRSAATETMPTARSIALPFPKPKALLVGHASLRQGAPDSRLVNQCLALFMRANFGKHTSLETIRS